MSYPRVAKETVALKGKEITAYLIEFKNAVLGVFTEEEGSLGTLALALPAAQQQPNLGRSTVLLGYKNSNIARILAEYLAAKFGKISLASVFLRFDGDIEAGRVMMRIIQKVEEKDFKPLKGLFMA